MTSLALPLRVPALRLVNPTDVPDGTTVPSVATSTVLRIANTAPTTITNLSGAPAGEAMLAFLLVEDAYTTLADNSTILTGTGSDLLLSTGIHQLLWHPTLGKWILTSATAVAETDGILGVDTLATLAADLAHDAGTVALVTNDPTPANNGLYRKTGASGAGTWVAASFDRVAVVEGRVGDAEERIDEVEDKTAKLEADGTIDPTYAFAILDAAGKVALGVRSDDGAVEATLATLRAAGGIEVGTYDSLEEYALAIADASGRMVPLVNLDGTIVGQLAADGSTDVLVRSLTLQTGETFEHYDSLEAYTFAVVDAANQVLFSNLTAGGGGDIAEVVAARGSRDTLNERLDVGLTPYGRLAQPTWGGWLLRQTRMKLGQLAIGEAAQLIIQLGPADSWTFYYDYYAKPLATRLKAAFGDAGPGYLSFGYKAGSGLTGNVSGPAGELVVSGVGTWDFTAYYSSNSPDLASATTSTLNDQLSAAYTGPSMISAVRLFYEGGAGAIRYRWVPVSTGIPGAWTALDLTPASGTTVTDLAGFPAGAWTLQIQQTSGSPRLYGMDVQSAASGVRVHKMGSTGSKVSDWLAADATEWQTGVDELAPDLIVIPLGTNDQNAYAPVTYGTNLAQQIARARAARPAADVLVMMPPENTRAGHLAPMAEYAVEGERVAIENQCAFLNLQYVFGAEDGSDYADGSDRPWIGPDDTHPVPATGGRVIMDALYRFLTQGI